MRNHFSPHHGAGAEVEYVGVTKKFGDNTVLDSLDLRIEPGEFVALLGPSGCGKTTALRILGGFETPTTGIVKIAGAPMTDVPAHRRGVGMVFQSYSLFPHLTVAQNIAYGLALRKAPRAERTARVRELLDVIGMRGFDDRYPAQLSGGQQQRVALARALATSPGILLLDEPLSALDAQVRASLREEIRQIQLRLGVTVLFVTHDQEEALAMADRVAVMRAGRIEQIANPTTLYNDPATEFVATFVGTTNVLEIPRGAPIPSVWQPRRSQSPDKLFVRPEALSCEPSASGAGEVVGHLFMGSTTRVTVRTGVGEHPVRIDLPSHLAMATPVGQRVDIRLRRRPALREDAAGNAIATPELVAVS
ncbi:ABC transporter ATP-binding protein [Rhodococcus tukisamuensis]|uniref:ABC-type quaternary amine transporter n=1 Tax=Rhodococcus tukisamuensis TaxID=168276 RepID=A0A1G6WFF8_9NOCA|nr:ABC transporter ATP-binding protein [Rhodococcus tukisamuensis]SDD64504.1 putative spermidine/putrescine transport system ATP-binding protein [Rhodococcus tukisamuensis]